MSLVVVHSNRLETLFGHVVSKLPSLPPLAEEVWLAHTQGAADWMKMALAETVGVCTAVQVQMPGSFLWSLHERLAGPQGSDDRFDKSGMLWRLYALLGDEELRRSLPVLDQFLANPQRPQERRYQLARRIADLFDQYMVYRSDWLVAWLEGKNEARLSQADIWQAELFRQLQQQIPEQERSALRLYQHEQLMTELHSMTDEDRSRLLPRRIVFIAAAAIQPLVLEALVQIASMTEVVLLVFNPCRYHWSDIISNRDLFRQEERRRQRSRRYRPGGVSLQDIPIEDMHTQAHPLLAAWGQLGRDFMGQLDTYDEADQGRFDLFSEEEGSTLLHQVQNAILDLLPLQDHPRHQVPRTDHSIRLEVTYSRQREVEVLQDTLLALLAEEGSLSARDIVVMVPDIETYIPHILATMNRYDQNDSRTIPYRIADRPVLTQHPLLRGLEQLLRIDEGRLGQSEFVQWLAIPALAHRLGLDSEARDQLIQLGRDAGLRWGLDRQHRKNLDLEVCDDLNSWHFALEQLLAGYAGGTGRQDHLPFAGVKGSAASSIGALALLVERLHDWLAFSAAEHTAQQWQDALTRLVSSLFKASDSEEEVILDRFDEAMHQWRDRVERQGDYRGTMPLSVLCASLLEQLEDMAASSRFQQSGVVFCSLLPLRALPFRVVCMLGLNEGAFPRAMAHDDFDLMQRQGQFRLGDRSRIADDRWMFLQAILSARDILYLSWQGYSRVDGSRQPASLLLVQFMDYLDKGWQAEVEGSVLSDQLSRTHPMTNYHPRYFSGQDSICRTYAHEWSNLHRNAMALTPALKPLSLDPMPLPKIETTVRTLTQFFKNPAKVYFEQTLRARLQDDGSTMQDTEVFDLNKLDEYRLVEQQLQGIPVARIRASGNLPVGVRGTQVMTKLEHQVQCMQASKKQQLEGYSRVEPTPEWFFAAPNYGLVRDQVGTLWQKDHQYQIILLHPGPCKYDKKKIKAHIALQAWFWMLLAAPVIKDPLTICLIGTDVMLCFNQHETDAEKWLGLSLHALQLSGTQPLPLPLKTMLAYADPANEADPMLAALDRFRPDSFSNEQSEADDSYWARLFRGNADDFAVALKEFLQQKPDWPEFYAAFADWLSKAEVKPLVDECEG